VDGLNFFVDSTLDEYEPYAWASAEIHGEAWFVIEGGVGTALAYFNYDIFPLQFENPVGARTNFGSINQWEPIGPLQFQYGVPFLLTIDAHAFCCFPSGELWGHFSGLDRITTLAGEEQLIGHLTELPIEPVPEPLFLPMFSVMLSSVILALRRGGSGLWGERRLKARAERRSWAVRTAGSESDISNP
jgi:hypothetical protein